MSHGSPAPAISLRAAADELGLHYMTVYRYVRTGRLPAVKVGGEWKVERADLDEFRQPSTEGPHVTRLRFRTRLQDRLLAADEPGSWAVLEAALASGASPEEAYLRLLIPAVRDIGQRWEAGDLAVLDEHQATAVATRLVGRMGPKFLRPGRRRGTVVVGAVSGDTHTLAPALLADLLRGRGFDAIDLGGDTPVEAFAQVASGADRLVAVLLSCSSTGSLGSVEPTLDELRRAGCPAAALAGGTALDAERARALGADGGGRTAEEALALVERAAAGSSAR